MIVFVDFDGVLRRESSPKNQLDADCVQRLERAVLIQPEARVVIASTWRLIYPLEALRKLFSEPFAARIEGVTPDIFDAEEFQRHCEIRAYLSHKELSNAHWIAVDDDREQYMAGAPVIHVDPSCGFDEKCARQLLVWLAAN